MAEIPSTNTPNNDEDARLGELRLLLAEFGEMPSITCLLRFIESDIVKDAHGELMDLAAENGWAEFAATEPELITAADVPPSLERVKEHGLLHSLQTRADLYCEDFLAAFDSFVSRLLAEAIAVKLIHFESKLAIARRNNRLDEIAGLSQHAEKYRRLAEQFSPPAHLTWYLDVLNQR